ncbi:MAG: hypothetical protein M1162_00395 [Candidatus Thermoplasmatota archaeon]|nr:hypothetical protein [Candidatus Thermoplasmatota archaeon]
MSGQGTIGSYLGTIYSLMYMLPPSYLYLTTVMISLAAIFLLFKGNTAWNLTFMAVGAYYGFVFALYITNLIHASDIPIYLIFIIGGVLGAILMKEFVRIALPGAIGILAFLVAQQAYPQSLMTDILAGVVIFGICYGLYAKITMILAGMTGAFLLWFNLTVAGVSTYAAQAIAGLLFAAGVYLQLMERKRLREERRRMTRSRIDRISRIVTVRRERPARGFVEDETFSDFY